MPGFRIDRFYALDPARLAALFIATELDIGKSGRRTFHASAPVLDWESVRAQMLYLHGAIRMKHAG